MLVAVSVVVFVIGLGMMSIGRRGRLVRRGPHCGSCGFDLAGLAMDPGARCPECGAVLTTPGAVRQELRHTRRGMLVAGILTVLLAAGFAGSVIYGSARRFNWNAIKPEWLLCRELRSASIPTADAAIQELNARLAGRSLASVRASWILEQALERQADAAATWTPAWGDYLETARTQGMMSPEQLASYARHAASITIDARPRVAAGGPLRINARVSGARAGQNSRLSLVLRCTGISEAGKQLDRGGGGGAMGLSPYGLGTIGSTLTLPGPPGRRTLASTWTFKVVAGRAGGESALVLAQWEHTYEVPVEVLPEGMSTVEVFEDEAIRPRVEAALRVNQLEVSPMAGRWSCSGMINAQDMPVNAAFDVYWRATDGSAQWKVGAVTFAAGTGGMGYGISGFVPEGFDHPVVDVVLRPSIAAASQTTDLFRIWNGEVVIPGVKVGLPPAQTR